MASFKFSLVLIFVSSIAFALLLPSFAQNSPKDYLNAHNKARAAVGAGLPPLTWDKKLENFAQNYANKALKSNSCHHLVHSDGPYGECLAAGSPDLTGVDSVNLWISEKPFYDHKTNTCAPGKVCGHYTQVIWKKTTHLGCAKVHCADNWSYVICSYDPPGNVIGEPPY